VTTGLVSEAARRRLATRLRRVADRIDAPEAAPAPEMKLISRTGLREVQMTGLQMIRDYSFVSRERGPSEGFVWFPREVLHSMTWLITTELETRERDFAAIEKDPLTVWR